MLSEARTGALHTITIMAKVSFKQQVLLAREQAIIESAARFLAEKGFESMTVDEVAADVGIAKASLYKHFASKEALAAAAMTRFLQRVQAELATIKSLVGATPLQRLEAITRWTMTAQLAGEVPSLPSENSALRTALVGDMVYMGLLIEVSETLGAWITQAQADGVLSRAVPPEVILYTLFARACDPVLGVLKAGGHPTEQILEWVMATCFGGLLAR
jgi:TetR/AcrR family transcriptional regulator, regulator of autoinduction and epiphytic fitness